MRFLFFFIYFINLTYSQEIDSIPKNDKLKILEIGLSAFFENDTATLKKSHKNLLSLYKKEANSILLAKHYQYKAMFFELKYKKDSAYYYYHQSKNISKKTGDSLEVGRRLLSMAILQREAKDYLGSEINSIEALQYLEPIKPNKYLISLYNLLGLTSSELKKKEAETYYKKALKINKSLLVNNRKALDFLYITNNLGLLYQNKKKHKKAISYFKKGLAFDSIKKKHPRQYALLLENLAFSNYSLEKKEKVFQQYNEVLAIKKRLNNLSGASTTHINISNYYKDLKQNKKAEYHSKEALKYAKQTQNNNRWLEALKNLSDLTIGKQSKQYLEEYIILNDSLFQKERLLKNQFAKIRYETSKKEKENTVLKSENEKKQAQIAYHKQQQTIGWLAAASVLLLLILSITFFLQRRRKLLYQAQLEAAEARENERQQIAKSLHDEVAGDLRMLHNKLEKSNLVEEAQKLNNVKENVRNLSHQLSSVSFDEVSFKDQIINLVSDYFELDFKISVNGLHECEWQYINDAIKRLLYLGIRESIQNCKKYAQASKIIINLTVQKNYVLLNITDNGIGFDTKISKKGIGLRNLQERVEDLNGTLNISSEIGSGTKTNIQIPLNAWTNKNTPS
ncbi:tetratricopeptide repeat-containing sensor histidine kinase [uncultured Tenacibaculum sp.]|uniref:tetratricopeptide repeat-containing sensor histidine kinase n=1 Tax=uncultured Tenacibaculum sp. TaxID=174713 RepID=UPI00262AF9DD|nr:tetratricopeptide repeat-containing sensor histidine kinase [uncultured Tenacibaculum sp.]